MTDHDLLVKILDRLDSLDAGQQKLEAGQAEMRADIRSLQADVRDLQAGQAEMRADIRDLQADVRDLQAGQKKLEAGQDAIREEVKALSDKMDRRFDDIARNVAEAVDVVVDKIDGVRVATAKNGYRLDVLEGGRKA